MFSKPQVELLKAMKLLEAVLEGRDTEKAERFVAKWRGRVDNAAKYIESIEEVDSHVSR